MILAIDTSIGTCVALVAADGTTIAEHASADTRGHAESIDLLLHALFTGTAQVEDVWHANSPARQKTGAVEAVVVGMGPGPFTGLRVGIAAARAFALGIGVPIWPVLSHDAVASADGSASTPFVVMTDAKRREHYLTRYSGVADGVPERAGGSELVRLDGEEPDVRTVRPAAVSAAHLARVAIARRARGLATGPDQPQYLREPDAVPPAGPKRVS